jgi:hypothetical protein
VALKLEGLENGHFDSLGWCGFSPPGHCSENIGQICDVLGAHVKWEKTTDRETNLPEMRHKLCPHSGITGARALHHSRFVKRVVNRQTPAHSTVLEGQIHYYWVRKDIALESIERRVPRANGKIFTYLRIQCSTLRMKNCSGTTNSGHKWPERSLGIMVHVSGLFCSDGLPFKQAATLEFSTM